MKFVRAVFIIEALFINLGIGLMCFFFPAFFVTTLTGQTMPPVPLELIRWYGVLLFVLAYGMLRALSLHSETALQVMVEALLVGDIAHLAACVFFFLNGGPVNFSTVFMVITSTFLASCRSYWLIQFNKNRAPA